MRSAVFPASAYVEMALSGIRSLFSDEVFELSKAAFLNAAFLPEQGSRTFQLAISPDGVEAFLFEIRSRAEDGDAAWTLHTTGRLRRDNGRNGFEDKPQSVSIADLRARYEVTRDAKDFYDWMARSGLHYGPAFQLVDQAWVGGAESLCRLRADVEDQNRYVVHPAILDAGFQSMGLVRPVNGGFHAEDTNLPVAIERVRIYETIPERSELFTQAILVGSDPEKGAYRLNIRLLDESGAILLDVSELEMQRVARQESDDSIDSLYTIQWVLDSPPEHRDLPDVSKQKWVIFADNTGVADSQKASLEFGIDRLLTGKTGPKVRQSL
jgi:myxalamid-type polyketide synthase MxaB/epothilone polyketide synthase D